MSRAKGELKHRPDTSGADQNQEQLRTVQIASAVVCVSAGCVYTAAASPNLPEDEHLKTACKQRGAGLKDSLRNVDGLSMNES